MGGLDSWWVYVVGEWVDGLVIALASSIYGRI